MIYKWRFPTGFSHSPTKGFPIGELPAMNPKMFLTIIILFVLKYPKTYDIP